MAPQLHMAHRRDIEGLRAVAVVLVVAFHVGVDRFLGRFSIEAFRGGFIGVDVFYVISGFLITGLLLKEAESTGAVSLRRFYARRIRRLLPASTFVLVVTVLAGAVLLPRIDVTALTRDALAAGLYMSNIWFGSQATDYLGAGSTQSAVLHYWSLSLEEQFYLLWPGLLVGALALARWRGADLRRVVAGLVGVVCFLSFFASLFLTPVSAPWAYFGLHTRAWELGVGAALVLLLPRLRELSRVAGDLLALVGGIALIASFALLGPQSAFPGWVAIFPVLGTALVIAGGSVATGGGPVSRLLSLAPLTYVGRISYSWYLWHWPFITLAGPATGATGRPVAGIVLTAAGLSFIAAMLTHAVVENPLRRSHRLALGRGPLAVAGGSVAIILIATGPLSWWASAGADSGATTAAGARLDRVREADNCARDFQDSSSEPCELGQLDSDTTVALVGDSHAVHLLPALLSAAERRGWRVLLYSKAACPPFDVRIWLDNYRREYTECESWRGEVWRQLAAERPDLVLLSRFSAYGDDLLDGSGEPISGPATAAWEAGVESTLERLSGHTRTIVLLRDVPRARGDVPACISDNNGDASACTYPSEGHVHYDADMHGAELAASEGIENVAVVDLSDVVCDSEPCTVVDENGVIKYSDSNHLTRTFSSSLGGPLGRELDGVMERAAALDGLKH